jgi:hypothetical protein
VVAKWTGLPGRPASLRALSDGAAIAAFPDLGVVGVVDADGRWRWTFRCLGRPVDAALDRQGRVWVAVGGDTRIALFDTQGRMGTSLELSARPRTVQLVAASLPAADGNTGGPPAAGLANANPAAVELAYLLPDLGQLFRVSIPGDAPGEGGVRGAGPTGAKLLHAGGRHARFAHLFADGGCLLADAVGVRCLDPQGKLVWKREGDIAGGIAVFGERSE